MDPIKLDNFTKILLATAQINYQAASLHDVNLMRSIIPNIDDGTHEFQEERRIATDEVLQNAADSLTQIMVRMADYINNVDCICPLDVRVSKVPFEILVHGKDETENSYEEEEEDPQPEPSVEKRVMIKPNWDIDNMDSGTKETYKVLLEVIDSYNAGTFSLESHFMDYSLPRNGKQLKMTIGIDYDRNICILHDTGCMKYKPKYEGEEEAHQPEKTPERKKMIKPDWVIEYLKHGMDSYDRERCIVLLDLIDRYNKGEYEFPGIGQPESISTKTCLILINMDTAGGIVVCHPGGCITYQPKYEGDEDLDKAGWRQ